MKRKVITILTFTILIAVSVYLIDPNIRVPAEELDVQIVTGYDLSYISKSNIQYEFIRGYYLFGENNKRYSKVFTSKANTTGGTREYSQLHENKTKIEGLIKVSILSENYARYGIRGAIDILFNNPGVNDTGLFLVYKGKPETVIKYEIPGYSSSIDFIEGLIKNHRGSNFFSDEYNARNIYVRLDSEGRNVSIPYIELKKEGIEITGLALFKGNKMVSVTNINEARFINMMLYNNVAGIVTLYKDNNYIDFYAKSTKKVKCYKQDDKYNFVINLKLSGDIISNNTNISPINSTSNEKVFERLMEESIKKQCTDIISKIKSEYKVDCLELGRVAAAKYGRRKGIDWNKIITNSNIEVNVRVKLNDQGRGNY